MAKTTKRMVRNIVIAFWITVAASWATAAKNLGTNPYQARQEVYAPDLLIVGGSSGGTAAALTAGRLGIDTLLIMRSPRELGGLTTNGVNPDSDLPIRVIGGLALELDVVARYTSGYNVGARHKHGGEGYFVPFHVFFNYIRHEIERQKSLTVVAGYYPVSVKKDPRTKRVMELRFRNCRNAAQEIVVRPKITIDAEIEGDVAFLAGVTMTLCREGRVPSEDPTRDLETYAGRIFTPTRDLGGMIAAGGPLLDASTGEPDSRPATMAWNGTVTLEDYGEADERSPWILVRPPQGYEPHEFDWLRKSWSQRENIYGVRLDDTHRRWNCDRYLSTVEGWRLPDGRHVLESMNIADREANERAHLARVIRGLYFVQHELGLKQFGLCRHDFHEGLTPKYRLSDFGTATNAGDAPLPSLIYMREGRRMVNGHVFGGKLMEDQGKDESIQKTYWHPRSTYFNAMVIDIHGVHHETVPSSGPEGMQLLRLAGYPKFGAPCIPFDVFVPRPSEATGLLVAAAGAYTHEAYAAFPRMETGRIVQGHTCAVAAYHALREGIPVHEVDVRKVQITNLLLHGQSIVYFGETIPGTYWHLVDQMLGARRVPERNEQGAFQCESHVSVAEMRTYLERLFRDYNAHPIPDQQLDAALAALGAQLQQPVSRRQVIAALTMAAGLNVPKTAAQPFADVPADTLLARQLAPWVTRHWISANTKHHFQPDAPIPFSEFKRHAYHVLFSEIAPQTVRPVDYRDRLVHDTFNRPDGPVKQLASGQVISGTGTWHVDAGNLRSKVAETTTYLFADAGQADVDVSVDVFLEQSNRSAAAGLVVRAKDQNNMQRFLLDTDGPTVRVRIDTLMDGKRTNEVIQRRETHRRGFSLRIVAQGNRLTYFVDGERVHQEKRTTFSDGTRVGLMNGGGQPSRFDNFEVRAAVEGVP